MRIQAIRALTGPRLTMNLKPSWLQTLTLTYSVVICFLCVIGTTSSRHGHATLTGYLVMIESGITRWIGFA
jgi:hypothetical protein